MPLKLSDVELLPDIWRNPDRVSDKTSKKGRILLEMDSSDGGVYKAVVDVVKDPYPVSFWKNKGVAQ